MAKITITKCDRCGKEINNTDITFDDLDRTQVAITVRTFTRLSLPVDVNLDLCDNCVKELKTFLGWPLKIDI